MHTEDMADAAEVILHGDVTIGHAAAVEDVFYSADVESEDGDEEDIVDDDEDEEQDMLDDEDDDDDEEEEFDESAEDQDDSEGQLQRGELRKAILAIQSDAGLSAVEKSKGIQALMTARWQASRGAPQKPAVSSSEDRESEADKKPTYHESKVLGCEHYQRGAKLKARCCGQWHTCRFCHDEANDHTLERHDTEEMMCMHCSTIQPVGQDCASCGERLARYYCGDCKFWDDDVRKNIYHCADCKVCRVGKGEDLFHCKTCNACMTVDRLNNHKCIERILESDCPICGDFMFTSTATVMFMPCGHCIHYFCHSEYIQTSSTCPTCYKSLGNMSSFNERIDAMLAQQVMPPEYDNLVSHILCNDCEMRSDARYHFLYHKCGGCGSYNTKLLQTLQVDPDGQASSAPPAVAVGAAADMVRELEQASNPLPQTPLLFNRRSASDRGAEGTEHLAGAGDGGSIISNSRIRSGSVASSGHRPSVASTDAAPVTIIDYDEPDFD